MLWFIFAALLVILFYKPIKNDLLPRLTGLKLPGGGGATFAKAEWGGEEHKLTAAEAEKLIQKQQTAIMDDQAGVVASLMKLPNVIGVDLGPKRVRGEVTDDYAIRVKVSKKVPIHQLKAEDVVPAYIGGIPTDVVEVS